MSTPAQLTANISNAPSPTEPRSDESPLRVSPNAITYPLYAATDFIRPDEEPLYIELDKSLRLDLAPAGMLEHNLVDEIRRAMWRLRRYGRIEQDFVASETDSDPMQEESTAKLQLSVDRARSQSHRLLHKCTAELRKLQTERQLRNESFDAGTNLSHLGICDIRAVRKGLHEQFTAGSQRQKLSADAELDAILHMPYPPPATTPPAESGSFCKNDSESPQTPRNGGKNAPATLQAA